MDGTDMTAKKNSQDHSHTDGSHRHRVVALSLAGVVAGMLGLSYAAVPLYDLFCRVTGFGGTTQRAEQAPDKVLDRTINVRFDGNVAQGMPWHFRPVQNEVTLRIGESGLAFYVARNESATPVRGTATFNVTPEVAGYYFNKIDCFCFTEQELKPGQQIDMPLTFFVDPEIVEDPDTRDITEITLSYTFFPLEEESADVAARGREADGGTAQGG